MNPADNPAWVAEQARRRAEVDAWEAQQARLADMKPSERRMREQHLDPTARGGLSAYETMRLNGD